jgi:glycosyltransferase involved in cell wall biosynthesis
MKIAIIGTRGIPNQYGGFEQFAQNLSSGLVKKGHEVTVYSPHVHPYRENAWESVRIIRKFDPEYRIGTIGQFIYDLNCIIDSRGRGFDIIYQLGYTSSSIWSILFPRRSIVVTNMDGLEWKRTKYGKLTRRFLKYAEGVAVRKSDYLIADSLGIRKYLRQEYGVESEYIPYGATVFSDPDDSLPATYGLKPFEYDMLIARLEPENNIEMILDGRVKAGIARPFLVIANHSTRYGAYLKSKYRQQTDIIFAGAVYELTMVNNLRYHSNLYFHGHSVGGTNPSLLEAMASASLIAAHRNDFNESILGGDAYYFNHEEDIAEILRNVRKDGREQFKLRANEEKIRDVFSWERIIGTYESYFSRILAQKQ